jgi:hypothetical protein
MLHRRGRDGNHSQATIRNGDSKLELDGYG